MVRAVMVDYIFYYTTKNIILTKYVFYKTFILSFKTIVVVFLYP